MRVKEALQYAKYLSVPFHIKIDETEHSEYVSGSLQGCGSYMDVCIDKLHWALSSKLGVSVSETNYIAPSSKGISWVARGASLINTLRNFDSSKNWSSEHFYGSPEWDSIELSLKNNGVLSPNLITLFYALYPLCFSGVDALHKESIEELENDFRSHLESEELDFYEYRNSLDLDCSEEEYEELFEDCCQSLALVLKYLLDYHFSGKRPTSVMFDVSSPFTDDMFVCDYVDDWLDITQEYWLDFLHPGAFNKCIIPFLHFMAYPSYTVYTSDGYNITLWFLRNQSDVPCYMKWREEHKNCRSALVKAMDSAVAVIRSPWTGIENYVTVEEVLTDSEHIIMCTTGDYDFSYVNPLYHIARNIFDTLFPKWKQQYLETDHV